MDMALLAEEVVQEWINRQGFFTIRGIKIGVHEIDILAFKPSPDGNHVCRQIEVQVSTNPIAYVSKVPKSVQKKRGIGPDNAKERKTAELKQGIREWIQKKFDHPKKVALRKRLYPGEWSRELVVNAVKHPEELDLFRKAGVNIIQFTDVLRQVQKRSHVIEAAAGNHLLTLMLLGKDQAE
ncbi:MAG: hypothetical protein FJ222_07545 [Lentisphaerae bacterium]|nr:hypothetical protein [Lentisphaerota bacterium]